MGQPFGKTYDSLLGAIGWQLLNGIQDKDVRRGQERDAIPLADSVNGLWHEEHVLL